jgi:YD repeat-containing protein
VVFSNGNIANVEYDFNGNIIKEVDENHNEISNRYDALNRLIERRSRIRSTGKKTIEQYEYDGLGRLVAATAPDGSIQRSYDSLSRLLTEHQDSHALTFTHDSAGNVLSVVYPGGEEVHKVYDIRKRVTSVKNKSGETIASFTYRSNDQMVKMMLGNDIETDFSYNNQERLESIKYKRTGKQNLIEGFGYQYDDNGKMTHEIQLSGGAAYGDRYYYDDANRAARAQYGVLDVFDPNSSFDQETSYKHFPEGSWKQRVDVDGQGQVIEEQIGTIDQRNNYQSFGKLYFLYDANGNCIRKGKSNPGYCDNTYDQDNRLIKCECYDSKGNKTQTIEYFYDSLGRQIRKVVTDRRGEITETTYVWLGNILIEEYENGVLVRSYLYGNGSIPVQLSTNKGTYYYTHNGSGLASGLVYKHDPSKFAEKYRYELTGASGIAEINGVKLSIPLGNSTNSSVLNSILSGGYLRDWQNKTHSGIGGIHFSPEIDAALNAGQGHHYGSGGNGAGDIGKQLNSMLGHGSFGKCPTGTGNAGGLPPGVQLSFRAPSTSLYSAFRTVNKGQGQSSPVLFALSTSGEAAVFAVAFGVAVEVVKWGGESISEHYKKEAEENRKKEDEKERKKDEETRKRWNTFEAASKSWENAEKEKNDQKDKDKKAEDEALKNAKNDGGGTVAYVDPDSGSTGGSIVIPSPRQVETIFMKNKRPINPNSGIDSPQIEAPSSKGPSKIDLIAHYDDSHLKVGIHVGGGTGFNLRLAGGGFTDTVQGFEVVTPEVDSRNGGGTPNTARSFP